MRESCLVYCYSGIQSLFEVVLLYTFYTVTEGNILHQLASSTRYHLPLIMIIVVSRVLSKIFVTLQV